MTKARARANKHSVRLYGKAWEDLSLPSSKIKALFDALIEAENEISDLSFSDGANEITKPAKARRGKIKTTIENTKPQL